VELATNLHLVPRLKMYGIIHPLPQYVFMAWFLVKHRDTFMFTNVLEEVQVISDDSWVRSWLYWRDGGTGLIA
jgi:hypothetical protein